MNGKELNELDLKGLVTEILNGSDNALYHLWGYQDHLFTRYNTQLEEEVLDRLSNSEAPIANIILATLAFYNNNYKEAENYTRKTIGFGLKHGHHLLAYLIAHNKVKALSSDFEEGADIPASESEQAAMLFRRNIKLHQHAGSLDRLAVLIAQKKVKALASDFEEGAEIPASESEQAAMLYRRNIKLHQHAYSLYLLAILIDQNKVKALSNDFEEGAEIPASESEQAAMLCRRNIKLHQHADSLNFLAGLIVYRNVQLQNCDKSNNNLMNMITSLKQKLELKLKAVASKRKTKTISIKSNSKKKRKRPTVASNNEEIKKLKEELDAGKQKQLKLEQKFKKSEHEVSGLANYANSQTGANSNVSGPGLFGSGSFNVAASKSKVVNSKRKIKRTSSKSNSKIKRKRPTVASNNQEIKKLKEELDAKKQKRLRLEQKLDELSQQTSNSANLANPQQGANSNRKKSGSLGNGSSDRIVDPTIEKKQSSIPIKKRRQPPSFFEKDSQKLAEPEKKAKKTLGQNPIIIKK